MGWFILASIALAWVCITEVCGYMSLYSARRIRRSVDSNGSGSDYTAACEQSDRDSVAGWRVASAVLVVQTVIFAFAGIVQTYWWSQVSWTQVVAMIGMNMVIVAGVGYPVYRLQRWRNKRDCVE
jgi:hypothetical protein